jgi:hypothetical protein
MSTAHANLIIDVETGSVVGVDIFDHGDLMARGHAFFSIHGLSETSETWDDARAACLARLGAASWVFGQPGTPVRDAIDRLVAGEGGKVLPGTITLETSEERELWLTVARTRAGNGPLAARDADAAVRAYRERLPASDDEPGLDASAEQAAATLREFIAEHAPKPMDSSAWKAMNVFLDQCASIKRGPTKGASDDGPDWASAVSSLFPRVSEPGELGAAVWRLIEAEQRHGYARAVGERRPRPPSHPGASAEYHPDCVRLGECWRSMHGPMPGCEGVCKRLSLGRAGLSDGLGMVVGEDGEPRPARDGEAVSVEPPSPWKQAEDTAREAEIAAERWQSNAEATKARLDALIGAVEFDLEMFVWLALNPGEDREARLAEGRLRAALDAAKGDA